MPDITLSKILSVAGNKAAGKLEAIPENTLYVNMNLDRDIKPEELTNGA